VLTETTTVQCTGALVIAVHWYWVDVMGGSMVGWWQSGQKASSSSGIVLPAAEEKSKGIFDSFEKLEKATVSFVMSVRSSVCLPVLSAWNRSVANGWIFMKFDI